MCGDNVEGPYYQFGSRGMYDIRHPYKQTGDFVWPNFIEDLEEILRLPVHVSRIYGNADYICNWVGGQAISLAVNYTHAVQFRTAAYRPMTVDGLEYGETQEYGNFSFTRVYQAGHEVPYYRPIAALQLFNRSTAPYSGGILQRVQPRFGPDIAPARPRGLHTRSHLCHYSLGLSEIFR
ncbi:alpha/beta-hydrolase [Aspergillus sclerotioniger CBS 115572]|uniref:Alpha/beta-hydrolase n=1 Tax=Aspergillus sclerotioniger CBS 115572 TaxID=1450535 RepID=A0A317VHN1_9EURO|nr:alpha/beta-hydrolase [Aspergillus sclerotioniger CBS 115572]PWY72528.1 alpha/beta-hydrolase [Aspergillus sclerotioniger CBS 115572]